MSCRDTENEATFTHRHYYHFIATYANTLGYRGHQCLPTFSVVLLPEMTFAIHLGSINVSPFVGNLHDQVFFLRQLYPPSMDGYISTNENAYILDSFKYHTSDSL